jgi:hypothetical protein
MATAVETKIAEALFAHLKALVFSPVLRIAFPNMEFEPPADGKWLRATFHPVTGGDRLIGSDDPSRIGGFMQVSVFWPLNRGEGEPRDVAGQIASHFAVDLRLEPSDASVRIIRRPDVGPMLVENIGVQIPVSIYFEAFA